MASRRFHRHKKPKTEPSEATPQVVLESSILNGDADMTIDS